MTKKSIVLLIACILSILSYSQQTQSKVINVSIDNVPDYFKDPSWNSWHLTGNILSTTTSGQFTYSDGSPSTVTASITRQVANNDNTVGYTGFTGLPDSALRYVSSHSNVRVLTISGLDSAKLYSISLYSSRNAAGYTTKFTYGSTVIRIPTSGNKSAVAVFSNITPGNGQISIQIDSAAGSTNRYNHLNAFVITETPVIPCKADAGVDIVVPRGTGMVTLNGSPSFGGTGVQYQWTLLNTVDFDWKGKIKKGDQKVATTQILPYADGGYNFELSVSDDDGCVSRDTVNLMLPWGTLPPQFVNSNGWRRLTAADAAAINAVKGAGYAKVNDVMIDGANAGTINGGRLDITLFGVSNLTIGPGTKIFIRAGNYRNIRMVFTAGLVAGSAADPIIITNYDGQVSAQTFTMSNIKNAKMTGEYVPNVSGDVNFKGHADGNYAWSRGAYGFYFNNDWVSIGSAGIRMAGTTTDSLEFSFIEIANGNFAGMMLKNDNTAEEWKFFRIHDMYIHDIHGEGVYLGSTGADPQNYMTNWKIYNNRIVNAGNEIFQMNQIGPGTDIHNNVFINSASNAKSTFSFSSQENGIQLSIRGGHVRFRNNIAMGMGYSMYNFFFGSKTGITLGNDTVYVHNNLHLYAKGFIGGYMRDGNGAFPGMVVKITDNYFGKFHFKGNQLFSGTSGGRNVNTNTVIRTAGNPPLFYSRNNIIDGSDGKTVFMTGTGLDAAGNTTAGIVDPQFVNSGWPADFNWDGIEEWCDSIYRRWGDETPSAAVLYAQPVVYNIGDYVICFSKIYKSKINGNANHMPVDVTDDYWELQTWGAYDYPPEDYRLISGSFYAVKGMGLLDIGPPLFANVFFNH